jgi:hypothetical protein
MKVEKNSRSLAIRFRCYDYMFLGMMGKFNVLTQS